MNFFNSKAETLEALSKLNLQSATILPVVYFSFIEWQENQNQCLNKIRGLNLSESFIVRSSCKREDSRSSSNAGAFLSLPNITFKGLTFAIKKVFQSYGDPNPTDQVLIQPNLQDVQCSGVAFSHDPASQAPYRVISWSTDGDTDNITRGNKGGQTLFSHRSNDTAEPHDIKGVIRLLNELEICFNGKPIDIEFAFAKYKKKNKLFLLQLRPLIMTKKPISSDKHQKKLTRIENYLTRAMKPTSFLKGNTTVFGVMPDWNPAEIIGLRPRALAKSLYRDLITDSIWAYQRSNYGYRNLRGFPLMVELEGLPYIDTRISFNSFIPQDISGDLAEKLVNHYIKTLIKHPVLHDKIEFDIVHSCYTLDLQDRLNDLPKSKFSSTEIHQISDSLLTLTNRILNPDDGLMVSDAKRIKTLKQRRNTVLNSDLTLIEKIYCLIEDGKRYGTLPFAGLARAGFIAVQLLNSLVAKSILSLSETQHFLRSIRTVTSQMSDDFQNLELQIFLKHYGHLRPGTYDILSPRYDEQPSLYFNSEKPHSEGKRVSRFQLRIDQMRSIDQHLSKSGLEVNALELLNFIRDAITLRESSKFEFTKNLSDSLSLIGSLGYENGFNLKDISHVNIEDIKQLYTSSKCVKTTLQESINRGKTEFKNSNQISLPPLITEPNQVWQFHQPDIAPNYITQKTVTAPVVDVSKKNELSGAIVCITSADPGYDWLFSHSIGGLVTAWGGVNSHMAIRAGEMGVPSIIGAGEKIFKELKIANYVQMDCGSRGYKVLR